MYTRQQGASSGKILQQQCPPSSEERSCAKENDSASATQPDQNTESGCPEPRCSDPNEQTNAPSAKRSPHYRAARRPKNKPVLKDEKCPGGERRECGQHAESDEPDTNCKRESPEIFLADPLGEQYNCEQNSQCSNRQSDCGSTTDKAQRKSGLSSLLEGFCADEILILAIIILLMMQGSDDILVLALCFILL